MLEEDNHGVGVLTPTEQKPPQEIVVRLMKFALALGILADLLLRVFPWGINFALWIGVLTALIAWGWYKQDNESVCQQWLGLTWLLSMLVVWREATVLTILNVMGVVFCLLLLGSRPTQKDMHSSTLMTLLLNALRTIGSWLFVLPRLFRHDIDWSFSQRRPNAQTTRQVLRGLIILIPILLIFTSLFSSADAIFKHAVDQTWHNLSVLISNSQVFCRHVFWSILFFFGSVIVLHPVFLGDKWNSTKARPLEVFTLGAIETGLILGGLLLLFIVFIVIQFRYLFGGDTLVQEVAGLTYAQYARSGFFALLKVALLLHVILMIGAWFVKESDPLAQRLFQGLSLGLMGLTVFIFISAFFRLFIYVDAYGLTQSRFYAAAVLVWLAIVFVCFGIKLLLPSWSSFAAIYCYSVFLMLIVLNVSNPDACIARINLARAQADLELDVGYLTCLSADAHETLLRQSQDLPQDIQLILKKHVADQNHTTATYGWRNWNYSRWLSLQYQSQD